MKRMMILLMIMKLNLSFSQNLVPNPSFESIINCPFTVSQVDFAEDWVSFGQSPDYYSFCSNVNSGVSIPYNVAGYQFPSHGSAYMGIQTFFTPGTREFFGCQLTDTLILGTRYFFSMKVVCSYGDFQHGVAAACASSKLGVRFSTVQYSINNSTPINNFAHIWTDSILRDTVNWTIISGSFIADSSYSYLSIGNYFDDSHTDTVQFISGYGRAYYLVDEICLTSDSGNCESISNTIEKINNENLIDFDPSLNLINFNFNVKINYVQIYNIVGELYYNQCNYQLLNCKPIEIIKFKSGVYIVCVGLNKGMISKKIIKIN